MGKRYNRCCKDGIRDDESECRNIENLVVDQMLCHQRRAGTTTACRCRARSGFWPAGLRLKETNMLHYAVVFLVIALIAALFGFSGIAAGAAGIAQILFVVFLIFAVISLLLVGLTRRS